jgi:thioredoxin 1
MTGDNTVMKVTEAEFRDLLSQAKVPVVVEFYADWCDSCRAFVPIFEGVSERLEPKYKFCKVNIDDAESLTEELGVDSVPTIMVFSNDRLAAQHVGGASEKQLESFITGTAEKL